MGKTTYTSENLAVDIEADDNFDNEFEIPGNFSPISVNQIDSNQPMHPTSSQPLSKKRSRSGDPIVRSMDRFANKMQLLLSDQVRVMQKFMQKPEVAEIFKAQQSEEQKFQFVASLLSGVFDN
ncbi:hypothetical protein QYF36_003035 [Acer negundo]|nr:hypothetical protein QYF36_003035 [Acer negundo]